MRVAFFPHVPHYTMGLTAALRRKGADVTVITDEPAGAEPPPPSLSLLRRAPAVPLKARDLVRGAASLREFDVVHSQGALNSIPAALAKRLYGVPYVLTEHGFPQPEHEVLGVNLGFEVMEYGSLGYFARRASGFATISDYARSAIERRNRVHPRVIYHGVDSGIFNQNVTGGSVRAELGLERADRLVMWATRFTTIKDPLTFVRAARLVDPDLRAKFLMVGDGPLRADAEREASAMVSSGRMVFKHRVRFGEMPEHYGACDAFVYTGFREGFGLAVAESMACARPVIVCRAGSLPEIVKDDGAYFRVGDPEGLARGIESILRDPRAASDLASRGGQRVRTTFTWDKAAESYLSLYEAAAKPKSLRS